MSIFDLTHSPLRRMTPEQQAEFYRTHKSPLEGLTERPGEEEQRRGLTDQSNASGMFGGGGEAGFRRTGGMLDRDAAYLERIASGQESVSKLQLADAAETNIAHQQSLAAGAAPRDAAMAMFGASRNAGEIASGLAGQQAVAGLQERQAAQRALAELRLQQRDQELRAALGGRQNAIAGLTGIAPGQSPLEQFGGALQGGAQIFALGKGK